jgi:transcriptional regulator with XRE-family HTH domain
LEEQCFQRSWSFNALTRRAGISHSVISKARGGIMPKWEACAALAEALSLPPEVVFRQAGLLAPLADQDGLALEEWQYLLARLSPRDREELRRFARIKIELDDRAAADASASAAAASDSLEASAPHVVPN